MVIPGTSKVTHRNCNRRFGFGFADEYGRGALGSDVVIVWLVVILFLFHAFMMK